MANLPISGLTASASNLASTDVLPVVQTTGVGPVKMTGLQIKTGIIGAGSVSIASGKTFTSSNTLTLAGTDSTTMTFPSTSATIARTDAGQTFTGAQTFSVGSVNGTGLDISQTWTGTGTYTGLKYNVGTDSGPANAASLLLDLQVGGSSRFSVTKAGNATFSGTSTASYFTSSSQYGLANNGGTIASQTFDLFYNVSAFSIAGNFPIQWYSSGSNLSGSADLFLRRAAAATLQLGAADVSSGAVAQTLQVQSNTGAGTTGPNFTIKGSAGTTAGGSIIFQTHNGTSYATALTIAGSGTVTVPTLTIPTTGTLNLCNDLITRGNDGTSRNIFSSTGAGVSVVIGLAGGTNKGLYVTSNSTEGIGFLSGNYNNSADVILTRDAGPPVALALRNSTNAQTFNIYGTYTDASNYERVVIKANSTACFISNEAAGSGFVRGIQFQTGGLTGWTVTAARNFEAGADNQYDIGATSSGRPRNVYIAGTLTIGGAVTANNALTVAGTLQLGTYGVISMNSNRGYFDASADGVFYMRNNAGTSFGRLQFGGTDASFPALKRSSARLQVTDATGAFGQNTGVDTANVAYQGVTFANLPTAAAGIVAYVTDASNAGAAWGDSVTAGGSTNKYLVWYNGTNWTVIGK